MYHNKLSSGLRQWSLACLFLSVVSATWTLVLHEFPEESFSSSDITEWNKSVTQQCGSSITQNGCDIFAGNQFGRLGNSATGSQTERTVQGIPPHFSMEMDLDFIALGTAWAGQSMVVSLGGVTLFSIPYSASSNIANFCPLVTSSTAGFGYIMTNILSHAITGDLTLAIQDALSPIANFGVKNLFIYVNTCHNSCLTCSADDSLSCLSCATSNSFQSGTSCECNLTYYAYAGTCRTSCPSLQLPDTTTRVCIATPNLANVYSGFMYNDFQNVDVDWTLSPTNTDPVTSCSSAIKLVGGYQRFQTQTITKTFTGLAPHYTLRVGAKIVSIDNFATTDYIKLTISSGGTLTILTPTSLDENLGDVCGNSALGLSEYQKYVEYNVTHTASSVTVTFAGTVASGNNGYWGVREIFIDVESCGDYCSVCSSRSACGTCKTGYYIYNGECLSFCPQFTTTSGSTCVEKYLALFTLGEYLLQSMWRKNFGHKEIIDWDFSFSGFQNSRRYNLCRGRNIIGGWGVGSSESATTPLVISKTFSSVDPHWQMRIVAQLYLLDSWGSSDHLDVIIDGTTLVTYTKTSATSTSNVCGTYSVNDRYIVLDQVVAHTSTSLTITFSFTPVAAQLRQVASFGLGEFDVLIDQCPVGCLTCTSATVCTSCLTGYYFLADAFACYADCTAIPLPKAHFVNYESQFDVPTCVCDSGYYYSSADVNCYACYYSCAKCTGPNLSDCTLCADIRENVGTCDCPDTYYEVASDPVCYSCLSGCETCTTGTSCTSCLGNKILNSSNLCVCPSKTYLEPTGYYCSDCEYMCAECTTSRSTCTSCVSGSHRVAPYTGNLTCPCEDGYYDTGDEICVACATKCATCVTTSTNCLTCNAAKYFTMVNGVCVCVDGRYLDSSGVCQPCQDYCSVCTGPGPSGCTTCMGTRTAPTCSCGSNQYEVSGDVTCYDCSYKCSGGCTLEATNCVTCASNRIQNATCDCPDGTYDTYGVATCASCVDPCATCTSASVCLTCSSSYRTPSTCACNTGYFEVTSSTSCSKCKAKCATCTGTSSNCTTCATGRITSSCTCPSGYYDDGILAECLKCYVGCATCTGGAINQCLSCTTSFTYDSSNLTCNCGDNQYVNSSKICTDCDYTCAGCTSSAATNCLACAENRSFDSNGLCSCSKGYVEENLVCVEYIWPDYCLVSTMSGYCDTCMTTFKRDLGLCVCPSSYYLSASKCLQCPNACATCVSSTQCVMCSSGYYKDSNGDCKPDVITSDSYYVGVLVVFVIFTGFLILALPVLYVQGFQKLRTQYIRLMNQPDPAVNQRSNRLAERDNL